MLAGALLLAPQRGCHPRGKERGSFGNIIFIVPVINNYLSVEIKKEWVFYYILR